MNQPFSLPFLNGSAKNMNVDGSSVNKTFAAVAPSTVLISQLSIIMSLPSTSVLTGFGTSASALSNGLIFKVDAAGNTGTIANIKTNGDLALMFGPGQAGNSSVLGLGNTVQGFGGSLDIFFGTLYLPANSPTILESGDQIYCVVRDNLSSLTFLSVAAQGVQIL